MRPIALLLLACALAAAEDIVAPLRFADGVERSAADFRGQAVMVYYFCGHCPNALGSLSAQVKGLVDGIEADRRPQWVICATPDIADPAELQALAKEKGVPLALFAHDPVNRRRISTKNILQNEVVAGDGSVVVGSYRDPAATFTAAEARSASVHRLPVQGLDDAKVAAAWWSVERGRGGGALKELATAAKRKGPVGEQAALVVAAAQSAYDAGLAEAGAGMAGYEAIERLAQRFDGLDPKPARNRLAELGKDAQMKRELKAREAWRTCRRMLASAKPADQAAGRDALAQLAKAMPDTVYGARAGAP
jgi:hypothetical protein